MTVSFQVVIMNLASDGKVPPEMRQYTLKTHYVKKFQELRFLFSDGLFHYFER
jgi:hypothetical protein